jgi:hypothetical protein
MREDPFIGRLGEWRHWKAGGWRWNLTPPVSKSKKGEGSRWGAELVRGKRRRSGGSMLGLLTRTGGRPPVASSTVVPARAAAARLREENDPSALGWSGPKLCRELGRLQKIPGKWKTGCRRGLGRKAN